MRRVEVARDCIAVVLVAIRRHVAALVKPAAALLSRSQRESVGFRSDTLPLHPGATRAGLPDANLKDGSEGNSGRALDRRCGRWTLAMQPTGVNTFTWFGRH